MVQVDHELEMQQMGDMAMGHDGEGMAMGDDDEGVVALAVESGSTDKVVMSFDAAGRTFIGCHEAGHWAAGMSIDIAVA